MSEMTPLLEGLYDVVLFLPAAPLIIWTSSSNVTLVLVPVMGEVQVGPRADCMAANRDSDGRRAVVRRLTTSSTCL